MRYYYDGDAADEQEEADDEELFDEHNEDSDDTGDDTDDDPDDGEFDAEDDGSLDDQFPSGDGAADTTAIVYCPYCGELNEIGVDPGGGSAQSYVEDCQVCCRPWRVAVVYDESGQALASVEASDD